MKVLFLAQIFETPSDTGSDRHFFFAKELVQKGHEVCVITGNVDYKNAKKRFEHNKKIFIKELNGIHIKYVPVFTNFKGSFFKRFVFFASYLISSIWFAIREPRVDIIYAVSTPLTVGLLGVIVSKIRGKSLVFEVTDVWPDAAIHTGVVSNVWLIGIAKIIEKICYRTAKKIICLTSGIKNNILDKGIEIQKTILIPNGVDFDLFKPVEDRVILKLRSDYGLDNKFVLMYLGAHGLYNSLETIIQTANILRDENDIVFVFVGDGDVKQSLIKYAQEKNLLNIKFIGTVPRVKSIELLSAANAFLLPNRKGEFFQGNLPNKLFDFLATGRPIIVAGHGETSELIIDSGAGCVVESENSSAMAAAIIDVKSMSPSARTSMGLAGREYVKKNFNRKTQADSLCIILENLLINSQ